MGSYWEIQVALKGDVLFKTRVDLEPQAVRVAEELRKRFPDRDSWKVDVFQCEVTERYFSSANNFLKSLTGRHTGIE